MNAIRIQRIVDRPRRVSLAAGAVMALFVFGQWARAQEALRASIAGADAAAARRERVSTLGYYNIRFGDAVMRFSSAAGVEYNDNVNLAQTNAVGDFIASPSLDTALFWPISDKNALNLNLDAGYLFYASRSELDRAYLSPGSELSFDIFVKDFDINLHDRPWLTQYSYQNPSVAGTGGYAQFQNTAGLSVNWDLNKAVINAGYDHANYWTLSSSPAQQDGASDTFFVSCGANFLPELQTGVEGGAGFIQFASATSPNSFQWNAGAFAKYQTSRYLQFRASVGYTVYAPERTGLFPFLKDTTLIYVDLSLSHRLNRIISYTLSASRGVNLSFFAQTYESYEASLSVDWNLLRKIGLHTPFSFQRGNEIVAGGETFEQFLSGISLDRPITKKLTAGLTYRLALRNSSSAGKNYTVNSVSLSFSYRF